jgi:signal transduction histidine kinase
VDFITQREGLWYLWIDNIATLLTVVYALFFLFYAPSKRFAKKAFLSTSTLMLVYIGIYSYFAPGWPMYSAAVSLWAFFYAIFESERKISQNYVMPYLALILIYNSYYQTVLTDTERWIGASFTISRVTTALFVVAAIAMINYISAVYQNINLEREQKKDSKISFQNDLFSILAHNIRTPLATLVMQYELASMRGKKSVELEKTEFPLKQLELTINALLDNRKALKSEKKIPVSELVSELSGLYESLQITIDAKVDQDDPIEFGLIMALDSFISNALKYDPSPSLKITFTDTLIFTLSDHGGGMSSTDFQDYGNPVISKSRGLGIGVHLSKDILTNLGYQCEVGNTKELGVTIRIYRRTGTMHQLAMLEHSQFKVLT